jgi:hypothetical protein
VSQTLVSIVRVPFSALLHLVLTETAGHFRSAQLVHKSTQNQLINSMMEDAGLKCKGFDSLHVTVH